MSVYVDQPLYTYGRMIMCHMIGDTRAELHAMAGAVECDLRTFVEALRRIRASRAFQCDLRTFVEALRRIRASRAFQ